MCETAGGIDWDAHFEQSISRASFLGEGQEYWDKRAPHICGGIKENPYALETLKRIPLQPQDTVLDIGAGNGGFTIPLARRACRVTALDMSPRMLEMLAQNARSSDVNNIVSIQMDWQKAEIGADIPVHDVVIASRCLPMGNLRDSIKKMVRASRRACYVTWRIPTDDDVYAAASRVIGKEYHPFPDHSIFYGMLSDMGIYACVDIYTTSMHHRYLSIDEAISQAVRDTVINEEERKKLRSYFEGKLSPKDGFYRQEFTMRWALIWWQTTEIRKETRD